MREIDKRIERISQRLLDAPQAVDEMAHLTPDLYPETPNERPPVAAAVLIALVQRDEAYSILYTQRSTNLRSHSGQIAFPGGKIDSTDADAAAAAVREAEEEVAMRGEDVEILGYLPTMFTGTNYLITPVVGVVNPGAPFVANPVEVESFFEVPVGFLQREEVYQAFKVTYGKKQQRTWKIAYETRNIWGITANITRHFRDLALKGNGKW